MWFLATHYPAKVPVTAPTLHQLKDIIWSELSIWHRQMDPAWAKEFALRSSDQDMRYYLKSNPDASFAVGRTGRKDNPEALQGFHSPNLLFVIDEASGVDDIIFEVAQGALTGENSHVLLTSNPTRTSGFFYRTQTVLRHRYDVIKVGVDDSPRVTQEYADDVAAQFGRDSNVYRVRVLGEFPLSEDDVLVPLHLLEAALEREIEPSDAFHVVWGLDVARFGGDNCALAKRQANAMLEPPKTWQGNDTMRTVGKVVEEWRETAPLYRPKEILVDVIGIGAGVVDRLRELGLPVRGINVGESPTIEGFVRLRDQLNWRARQWFEDRGCVLLGEAKGYDTMISQATDIHYTQTSAAKIAIEAKDDIKKRGGHSPDEWDAFVLTFAGGMLVKEDSKGNMDRYSMQLRKTRAKRTWRSM